MCLNHRTTDGTKMRLGSGEHHRRKGSYCSKTGHSATSSMFYFKLLPTVEHWQVAALQLCCSCSANRGGLRGRSRSDLSTLSNPLRPHHPVSPHYQPHDIHNGRFCTYSLFQFSRIGQCARCDSCSPDTAHAEPVLLFPTT